MKVIERIKEIIEFKSISTRSFERSIGASNNSIQIAIKRNASVKEETMNKILQVYPEINPIWLLTGSGEMLLLQDNKSVNKDLNLGSLDGLDIGEPKDSLDFYKKMHDQQANVIEGYQEQVIIAMEQLDENDVFIRKLLKKIKDLKEELNHYKSLINNKKLNG